MDVAVVLGKLRKGVVAAARVAATRASGSVRGLAVALGRSNSSAASNGGRGGAGGKNGDAAVGCNCGGQRYRRQGSSGADPSDVSCGGKKRGTKRGGARADDGAGWIEYSDRSFRLGILRV